MRSTKMASDGTLFGYLSYNSITHSIQKTIIYRVIYYSLAANDSVYIPIGFEWASIKLLFQSLH